MHIFNDFSSFVSLGQPDRTLGRTARKATKLILQVAI
jgi:hypothetical protein